MGQGKFIPESTQWIVIRLSDLHGSAQSLEAQAAEP